MLNFQTTLAFCVRKFLTKVLTPLTSFFQRQEFQFCNKDLSLWKKGPIHIIRWLSWCCDGAITLAYPYMRYNPIEHRRQEAQWEWASSILGISPKHLKQIAEKFLIKEQHLANTCVTNGTTLHSPSEPLFTILLCFHRHLDYFKSCLNSIQEAIRHAPSISIEILLINDDPSIDLSSLIADLDSSLRQKIVLRSHTENHGICYSLNEAITHAQGEWLLYLDCDDLLDPTVFSVLEKTIHQHPGIRFISSRAADIDTDGDVLFWRLRSEQPHELIKNNFANHLKVIKKELHDDIGLFKETFQGCQDYEFALRTAINEPLLFIPDYLYRYRWHNQSQTVSQNKRQNLTAMRIRQSYMLAIYWLTHGTKMIEWQITGPEAESWQKACTVSCQENEELTRLFHPISAATCESLMETVSGSNCSSGGMKHTAVVAIHRLPSLHHAAPRLATNQYEISGLTRSYTVTLQATMPYNKCRWKLLLVEIATLIIDRHRNNNENTFLEVKG